jgi:hypothetical protein
MSRVVWCLVVMLTACTDSELEPSTGNPFDVYVFDPPMTTPIETGLDCTPLVVDLQGPPAQCQFNISTGTPGTLADGDYVLTGYTSDCSSPYAGGVVGAMRIQTLPSGRAFIKEHRPSSILAYPRPYGDYGYVWDQTPTLRATDCEYLASAPTFEPLGSFAILDVTASTVTMRLDSTLTVIYTRQ